MSGRLGAIIRLSTQILLARYDADRSAQSYVDRMYMDASYASCRRSTRYISAPDVTLLS